jgi:serine/threonine-protein kinase
MSTTSVAARAVGASLDFVEILRRADIIPAQRVAEIHARVQGGTYPREAPALAARLVKKEILTEYQARRLLYGRAEGLAAGRYVLLDRLGQGAMGKVYKARHRLMGRIVALKFITRAYLARPHALPRFLHEMRLVGRLDHPNIIRTIDAEEIGRDPCIIMEYVPGTNLLQLLASRGPLPPEDVARYAYQAALGLAHAHGQGVIHRDVTPSNLLLGDDGRLRLLDLGLATLADDPDKDLRTFATTEGAALGTADYMSPEQAVAQGKVDARTDLYSLGCVMYHLLTGKVPFPEASWVECVASRIKGRALPLPERRSGLPPALVAVVERLMATHPDDRFATAALAAEALRPLTGEGAPVSPVAAPASAPAPVQTPPAAGASPVPAVDSGSSSVERRILGGPPVSHSASVSRDALPGWWLRLLTRLAESPPWLPLLGGALALVAAFAAGIIAAGAVR